MQALIEFEHQGVPLCIEATSVCAVYICPKARNCIHISFGSDAKLLTFESDEVARAFYDDFVSKLKNPFAQEQPKEYIKEMKYLLLVVNEKNEELAREELNGLEEKDALAILKKSLKVQYGVQLKTKANLLDDVLKAAGELKTLPFEKASAVLDEVSEIWTKWEDGYYAGNQLVAKEEDLKVPCAIRIGDVRVILKTY